MWKSADSNSALKARVDKDWDRLSKLNKGVWAREMCVSSAHDEEAHKSSPELHSQD